MYLSNSDKECKLKMFFLNLTVCFLLFKFDNVNTLTFFSAPETHDSLVSEGKKQYEVIARDARMPRYGDCWKEALVDLTTGCKNLDDEVQSRLALNFANCFLEKAGLRTYPCDAHTPISECVRNIETNAYTTFANFFTHTQNMCYFLQSQVWQEETDRTVERLAHNSELVSDSMLEAHQLQNQILQGQHLTMEYQRQLIENGSFLSQALEASKDNVKEMLAEFKHSTDEQRNLIFEVFDRVSKLQNLVVSEVNWLYTIIFYSACLMVIYIVTATKRTADARLALFIILSINLMGERLVCKYSLPSDSSKIPTELSEVVYERVWRLRNLAIGVCVMVLTVYVFIYKDYNMINNTLLQEIKKQNLELKQSMQMFQVRNRYQFQGGGGDVLDGSVPSYDAAISVLLSEETGFRGDEEIEEQFSDSDDDSYNSTKTDVSFDPGEWSDGEFETAANSRDNSDGNVTPTNDLLDSAVSSLSTSGLVSNVYSRVQEFTTPIKQVFTPIKRGPGRPRKSPSPAPSHSSLANVRSTSHSNRGHKSGSRGRQTMSTPRSGSLSREGFRLTPESERYNLRSRTPGLGMSAFIEETPEDFAKVVQAQRNITKRNHSKWKMAMKKHDEEATRGGYSSEDETG